MTIAARVGLRQVRREPGRDDEQRGDRQAPRRRWSAASWRRPARDRRPRCAGADRRNRRTGPPRCSPTRAPTAPGSGRRACPARDRRTSGTGRSCRPSRPPRSRSRPPASRCISSSETARHVEASAVPAATARRPARRQWPPGRGPRRRGRPTAAIEDPGDLRQPRRQREDDRDRREPERERRRVRHAVGHALTKARASAGTPSPSALNPKSLGSWPTKTVSASPFR